LTASEATAWDPATTAPSDFGAKAIADAPSTGAVPVHSTRDDVE
jgi:hypothetical protein